MTDCGGTGKKATQAFKNAKTKRSWWKQGYLMNMAPQLTHELKGSSGSQQSKFIKQLKTNDGTDYINILTTNSSVMSFFDGRPVDYSQLVPHIEIYKVYVHSKKGPDGLPDISQVKFPFQAFQDFDQWSAALKGQQLFRGRDAGIQKVDVKMEGRGKNPVQSNIMNITIKFFFNDIQTLFAPIAKDDATGSFITYSDLIRYPPSLKKKGISKRFMQSNTPFRIKLVLGWSVNPKNLHLRAQTYGAKFIDAVENSKITIVADMWTHNMEFNQDGSVALTVEYKGALESAFSSTAANILDNFNTSADENFSSIKNKIAQADEAFYSEQGPMAMSLPSGAKGAYNSMLNIQKANAHLEKIRADLKKHAPTKESPYPKDLVSAYQKVGKAYESLDHSSARKAMGRNALKELQAMANMGPDPTAAELRKKDRAINKATAQINRKIKQEQQMGMKTKGRGEKYVNAVKAYQKNRRALMQEMNKVKTHLRGKHLFEYVEYMRMNGRVAWISTGKKSQFSTYQKLLETIEEQGGSVKGEKRIANEAAKLDKAVKATAADSSSDKSSTSKAESASKKTKGGSSKKGSRTKKEFEANIWGASKYESGDKLMFFTLGDLISAIFAKGNLGALVEEQVPNFRILFGEYEVPTLGTTGDTVRMNLYYLPISLEIFQNFVALKIVGSGRGTYPLLQFIFDLVKFVMDKLQGVFGKAAQFSPAGVAPVNFKLDLTSVDLANNIRGKPLLDDASHEINLSGDAGALSALEKPLIKNTTNTFVFHAQKSFTSQAKQNKTMYRGNMQEDLSRGIFHFWVGGPNRGILKKIEFKEAKNNLFSTALMRGGQDEGDEASGQGIIKPSKYTCTVTLVGNPFFFIGQLFYVNTDMISAGHFAAENILNGGYYVVTSVDSAFGSDMWETTITGVLNIPDRAILGKRASILNSAPIRPLSSLSPEDAAMVEKQINARDQKLISAATEQDRYQLAKLPRIGDTDAGQALVKSLPE